MSSAITLPKTVTAILPISGTINAMIMKISGYLFIISILRPTSFKPKVELIQILWEMFKLLFLFGDNLL